MGTNKEDTSNGITMDSLMRLKWSCSGQYELTKLAAALNDCLMNLANSLAPGRRPENESAY
jgi:hypothetical protein